MVENKNKEKDIKGKISKGLMAGAIGVTSLVAMVSFVGCGDNTAGSNQSSTYSVSIRSELEGFEDTNLTVNKGTKIKDLLSLISSPVKGFRVEGFYKDSLCTERFDDNELVTDSTKIYVKFAVITYTVKAYTSQADQNPQIMEVEYNKSARPTTPSKASDEYGSYKFTGWTNIRGEKVDLNNITTDMEIYATFAIKEYNEYTISDFGENIRITKGVGEEERELTTADSLHYGDRIKIEYTESEGYQKTEFRVEGARLVEGTDRWYEVTGDIRVSYAEEKLAFVVGELQAGVTITDSDGNEVLAGSRLLYGDLVTVNVKAELGYHVTGVETSGLFPTEAFTQNKNEYIVRGDISVSFSEEINTITIKFYDYDGSMLYSEIVSHGNSITKANPTRDLDEKIGNYVFLGWTNLSGESLNLTNLEILEHDQTMEVYANYELQYTEYSLILPENVAVTVKRNDTILNELPNTLYYGDELTLSYTESEGHYKISFAVNGEEIENGATYVVTGNTVVDYEETIKTFEIEISDEYVTVRRENGRIVNSGEILTYGESITITVVDKGGYHVTAVYVNGKEIENGATYTVTGNVEITYEEDICLSYEEYSDGYLVSGLKYDMETSIEIPATYEGKKVYGIKEYAFQNNDKLHGVYFSSGNEIIGRSAFANCTNLIDIYISSTINNIGYAAFENCSATITLKSAEIYRQAVGRELDCAGGLFANPMSVRVGKAIDDGSNEFLNSIFCKVGPETNSNYYYFDAKTIFSFDEAGYNDGYFINGLNDSFANDILTINIPAELRDGKKIYGIRSCAFYGLKNLQKVNIADGVEYIEKSAFEGCENLISAYIGARDIDIFAFGSCESLKTIVMSESVRTIGESAFCKNLSLVNLIIGENVTNIGDDAFGSCSSLTNVTIPSSVTNIGDYAFDYCDNLTNVTIESVDIYNQAIGFDYNIVGGLLKNVTTINILAEIDLSSNEIINKNYFIVAVKNINEKTYFVFKNSSEDVEVDEKTQEAWGYLKFNEFEDGYVVCGGMNENNEVYIPAFYNGKRIYGIDNNAYQGLDITSLEIAEGVLFVGRGAFSNCDNLTSVTIQNGLTSIDDYAFESCSSLTSITIPNSVTNIGDGAFYDCVSLTSITIPKGVTSIGYAAFRACKGLVSVIFEDTEGWFITDSETATSGEDWVVTDSEKNATDIIAGYSGYYWKKK